MAVNPFFLGPIPVRPPGERMPQGAQGRPANESEARQALQEALRALDEARTAVLAALQQSTVDTCGIYIQRAGTQIGHARNNLLRASACLRAPPELRNLMNFRRIPIPPIPPYGRF